MNEKEVREIRELKWEPRGLSGRASWNSIDDLPINDEQKACVLEWLTQRLQEISLKKGWQIWDYAKSYDPLAIDTKEKIAHSYVMDMWDGGRHHPFTEYKQVEDAIFDDYFRYLVSKEIDI